MIANTLIPVAIYLRMSSDKQEASLDDQRREVLAYCKRKGYRIVREYLDEGISGWKGKQRLGFQQLIADAPAKDFLIVVCWDQSRFSRFDPMEANYFWHILRRENVGIETVKEGRLDFESLGGWLSASVHQHGKAEYVKSLAADVVRGQRRVRLAGKWIFRAPLGYRLEDGKLVAGEPEKVALLRRIFTMRSQGMGNRMIAGKLNAEGIKPVFADGWHAGSIKMMLNNPAYRGDSIMGRMAKGKFARVVDEITVLEGTHEALIDRELWDKVQAVNAMKTKRRSTGIASEGAPLAGLLYCGACGAPLYSHKTKKMYVCSAYHAKGQCEYNWVRQDELLAIVQDKIRQHVLHGSLASLTEFVEQSLAKCKARTVVKVDAVAVRKQIAAIDRKLAGAADRLLSVDQSLVRTIESKMLELKSDREALEEKLTATPEKRKVPSAKQIAAGMWKLDEVLRNGSPAIVRHALSQLIERIEIDFPKGRGTQGKKMVARAVGGTVYFTNRDIVSRNFL
jgi:site-specific DNA recombinase